MRISKRSNFSKTEFQQNPVDHMQKVDADINGVITGFNSLENGMVMKDSTNGKQYRIKVTGGNIVATKISP